MDSWLDSTPDNLNRMLQALARWLQQSWLKLKLTKMEVPYLSCGGLAAGIWLTAFDEALLVLVPSVKSLGVILDITYYVGPDILYCLVSLFPSLAGQTNGPPSHPSENRLYGHFQVGLL